MDTQPRCIIIIRIFENAPTDLEVDGGSVIDMFGAATMLERAAHKVLSQAEREAAIGEGIVANGRPS